MVVVVIVRSVTNFILRRSLYRSTRVNLEWSSVAYVVVEVVGSSVWRSSSIRSSSEKRGAVVVQHVCVNNGFRSIIFMSVIVISASCSSSLA